MASDSLTLYKLIILYMLDKLEFPLTHSQISDFILEKEYTNYFTLQKALHDLNETMLVDPKQVRNSTFFYITDRGRETISMFKNKIPSAIIEDIHEFFRDKKYQLKNEVQTLADYYPTQNHEYMVHCYVKEKASTLLELKLNVTSKDQAIVICDGWKQNSSEVYDYLVKKLMFPPQKNERKNEEEKE